MLNYELTCLVSGNFTEEQADEIALKIEDILKKNQVEIQEKKEVFKRRLAYVIKKVRNGYYLNFIISINKDKLEALKKDLSLLSEVIRFQLVKHKPVKKANLRKSESYKKIEEHIFLSQEKEVKQKNNDDKKISIDDLDKKIDEILDEEVEK